MLLCSSPETCHSFSARLTKKPLKGSDGVARIFSPHPDRAAPIQDIEQMREQLAAQKHSKQTVGDLEVRSPSCSLTLGKSYRFTDYSIVPGKWGEIVPLVLYLL